MGEGPLSQEEIDALLKQQATEAQTTEKESTANSEGLNSNENETTNSEFDNVLTQEEKDALGEIGNISMGSAATALSILLNKKVDITTPSVQVVTYEELSNRYKIPSVIVKIDYTEGLKGTALLVLEEKDAAIIADLMMGGDGKKSNVKLDELYLSAVGETMNQMMGSAATSMATMFNKSINISPPQVYYLDLSKSENEIPKISKDPLLVKVTFKMQIEDLVNTKFTQILPIDFAKEMVEDVLHQSTASSAENISAEPQAQATSQSPPTIPPTQKATVSSGVGVNINSQSIREPAGHESHADVHKAEFAPLPNQTSTIEGLGNIDLLLDVPLEVTVELGRTSMLLREILELGTGSVIELDKLAGEPVEILVNNKLIARGEVVIIDENFGVRITKIISPEERVRTL